MNGGYIIIKDDISSKITNQNGDVNYKGAFDYALEVFKSGKIALISLNVEGLKAYQNIMQVGSETMIFWFFVTSTDKITITFNKQSPDVFNINTVKGA